MARITPPAEPRLVYRLPAGGTPRAEVLLRITELTEALTVAGHARDHAPHMLPLRLFDLEPLVAAVDRIRPGHLTEDETAAVWVLAAEARATIDDLNG